MGFTLAALGTATAQSSFQAYQIVDSIPVGQVNGDLYAIDAVHRRLYGAGDKVVDIDRKRIVGTVADSNLGGFVIVPELRRGIVRDGVVFDLQTNAVLAHLDAQGDGYTYDSLTRRAFLVGPITTVVDVAANKVVGRVSLNSPTESAVADGAGVVYVVLSDLEHPGIAIIDARTMSVQSTRALHDCITPRALALDRRKHRLFLSCAKVVLVLDSSSGQVVDRVLVPGLADEAAFDEASGLLFTPNGDGGLTIIHQDASGKYSVAQTLVDRRILSHKVVLDQKTHRLYMPFEDSAGHFTLIVLGASTSAADHRR